MIRVGFQQCVPDERKDKLAREMVRPIFFFRCYKVKGELTCIHYQII